MLLCRYHIINLERRRLLFSVFFVSSLRNDVVENDNAADPKTAAFVARRECIIGFCYGGLFVRECKFILY